MSPDPDTKEARLARLARCREQLADIRSQLRRMQLEQEDSRRKIGSCTEKFCRKKTPATSSSATIISLFNYIRLQCRR